MPEPKISCSKLPKIYADNPASLVDREWVFENPTKFVFEEQS